MKKFLAKTESEICRNMRVRVWSTITWKVFWGGLDAVAPKRWGSAHRQYSNNRPRTRTEPSVTSQTSGTYLTYASMSGQWSAGGPTVANGQDVPPEPPVPPTRHVRSSVGAVRAAALRRSQPSLSSMEEENLRERRRSTLLYECRKMLELEQRYTKESFRKIFQTEVRTKN